MELEDKVWKDDANVESLRLFVNFYFRTDDREKEGREDVADYLDNFIPPLLYTRVLYYSTGALGCSK